MARRSKSELLDGFLNEARGLWRRGDTRAATERAARVFLAEGKDVFEAGDQPLLEATLKRLKPPHGYDSWGAWFASPEAQAQPVDERTDDEVLEQLARERGKTPLHEAAAAGDLARVSQLLAGGADPNAVHDEGHGLWWTPLAAATFGDHLEVMKRLLAAGARPQGSDRTPAVFSVRSVAAIEVLVGAGASLEGVDPVGRTLFTRIVDTYGALDLAEWLAARAPAHTPEQVAKLRQAAAQASPELRRVAEEFLARHN